MKIWFPHWNLSFIKKVLIFLIEILIFIKKFLIFLSEIFDFRQGIFNFLHFISKVVRTCWLMWNTFSMSMFYPPKHYSSNRCSRHPNTYKTLMSICLDIVWIVVCTRQCFKCVRLYRARKRRPNLHPLHRDVQYLSQQMSLYNIETHIVKYVLVTLCLSVEVASILSALIFLYKHIQHLEWVWSSSYYSYSTTTVRISNM